MAAQDKSKKAADAANHLQQLVKESGILNPNATLGQLMALSSKTSQQQGTIHTDLFQIFIHKEFFFIHWEL